MPENLYGSPEKQLRERFRAWEGRGRGWAVCYYPCVLEPPFRPFTGHTYFLAPYQAAKQRPGLFSFLRPAPPPEPLPARETLLEEEPLPEQDWNEEALCELKILLPEAFQASAEASEQLLLALSFCQQPVGFEYVSLPGKIRLQLVCRASDRPHVFHQLQAFAPSCAVIEEVGSLTYSWAEVHQPALVADLGLSHEFMRPLVGLKSFKLDPLTPLVGALSAVEAGEVAVAQVLFSEARQPWAENVIRAVHDNEGKPFELLGRDLAQAARQKVARPLFACRIRLAVKAAEEPRRVQLLRLLLSSFAQFSSPLGNELVALSNDELEESEQEEDLLFRTGHRPGMLLNVEELASICHLPGASITNPKLERFDKRSKAAPELVRGPGVFHGENEHNGIAVPVRLSLQQRFRHTYIIGASGTGKSTLLLNLILEDLEEGRGLCVLDPAGELIDAVCARMPKARVPDVVLLNPADEEYPVGFNILSAHSDLEQILLASDLVSIFRRLSTSWGDQMTAVLANAILAILESTEGGSLLELRRFLVDREFRTQFLGTVKDPEVLYFWQKEFPLIRGNPQAPILTRLDQFLRPKLIRAMVAQRRNVLDFRKLLDERRVLLCKLSQGAIGRENASLLGSLLVSKIQQLALSRQDVSEENRPPFFLYMDEFQNYLTASTAELLAGVRKYRLGLILAHQNLVQLERSSELIDAVLTNAATRVCFRLGDADARRLSEGFSFFEPRDFQNLGTGEAIMRVERAEFDFNLRTRPSAQVSDQVGARRTVKVIESSRARYATRRSVPDQPAQEAQAAGKPEEVEEVQAPKAEEPKPSPPKAKPAPSPGRGGGQHKYLQNLIKHFGEDRGFRASIEAEVLDGHGSVDVALERSDLRIAVEIGVRTDVDHELQNLQKCLAAGFDLVLLVALDQKSKARLIAALPAQLAEESIARVRCVTAEEIPELLDSLGMPEPSSRTVAGYKVKTRFADSSPDEKRSKMDAISEIISRSLRKNKPEE